MVVKTTVTKKATSLVTVPKNKKVSMSTSKNTFPIKFIKSKVINQLIKIVHRLQGSTPQVSSIADKLTQLMDPSNGDWHKHVSTLTKKQIKYLRAHRVQFALVKLRDIFIDDDIQRELDAKHLVKIANIKTFNVEFMSVIQGIKEPEKWIFHSTNSQHTVVLEAAYAYHGVWGDFTGDWRDLEVPFVYIETNDRSLMRRQFDVFNGKYSKPIGPADRHKIEVLSYRKDGNLDTENVQAAELQTICEDNGYEPFYGDEDVNKGHPKCITHVAAMRKYKGKPQHWEFILKTHSKYWPNYQIHGMEIDLYGFMYEYFKVKMNVDVYSKKFEQDFLNPIHAIIQTGFTSTENLSSESANTFRRWYSKSWGCTEDEAKVEAQGSFVFLMKIYRLLGGTHKLPNIVDLYDNVNAGDLINHLSSTNKKTLNIP